MFKKALKTLIKIVKKLDFRLIKNYKKNKLTDLNDLHRLQKINFLLSTVLFKNLNKEQLDKILFYLHEIKVNAGDVLIREGNIAQGLFIIKTGKVAITKHSSHDTQYQHKLAILQAGKLFGEAALFEKNQQTTNAVAVENTELFFLSEEKLNQLANDNPKIYTVIIQNISKYLVKRLSSTTKQMIFSLEHELELTRSNMTLSKLLIYTLLLWALYNLVLNIVAKWAEHAMITESITAGICLLFSIGSFMMMKQSSYSLSFYGLNLKNWKRNIKESLIWTSGLIVLFTAIKALAIRYIPALNHQTLFDSPDVLSKEVEKITNTKLLWIAVLTYTLFVPLQEFIFRGAIQSPLQELMPEKNKTLAVFTTTVLFSMCHLHLSLVATIIAFIPGMFWGFLYAKQKSLLGVCISHILLGVWCLFVINIQGILKPFFNY